MTTKEVWELYSRLRKHFKTTNFDFFNPNHKVCLTLKPNSTNERACGLLSNLPKPELVGLMLSNFIVKPNSVPIQLVSSEAKETWEFWDFRIQNKYWLFDKQLKTHFKKYKSLELEQIVQSYFASLVSLETLVGLYRCQYPFSVDHPDCIVSNTSKLVQKYDGFLSFSSEQLQSLLTKISKGE